MENLQRNNNTTNDDTSMSFVRESIEEIIEVAMIDFLMLSAMLKDLGRSEEVISSPEAGMRISEAITQLQCMDIFTQKLSHISKLSGDQHHPPAPLHIGNHIHYYQRFICRLN